MLLSLGFYHEVEVGNQGKSRSCVILKTAEASKASISRRGVLLFGLWNFFLVIPVKERFLALTTVELLMHAG